MFFSLNHYYIQDEEYRDHDKDSSIVLIININIMNRLQSLSIKASNNTIVPVIYQYLSSHPNRQEHNSAKYNPSLHQPREGRRFLSPETAHASHVNNCEKERDPRETTNALAQKSPARVSHETGPPPPMP